MLCTKTYTVQASVSGKYTTATIFSGKYTIGYKITIEDIIDAIKTTSQNSFGGPDEFAA